MPRNIELGRVILVGAGPGPVDLMTVRALRELQSAQAVLYDALIDDEVLTQAPPKSIRIQTGKRGGGPSLKQATINLLMLRLARRGLRVVRLKGGDPSVFGRSGEEAAFLRGHGVAVEVVPGVTAASAAAAQFDFPLTHRGLARSVTLATASRADGRRASIDPAVARDPHATLAFYMGRDAVVSVAADLVAAGRAPQTPMVAVENAGRSDARLFRGDLITLPPQLAAAACDGPVVILVGAVAGLNVQYNGVERAVQ